MTSATVPPKRIAATVDARGLICPFSLIAVWRGLNQLRSGEVLEAISDHYETCNETVPRMCDAEGHHWERESRPEGGCRFLIEKV